MPANAQIYALFCTLSILTNQYNFFANKLLSTRMPYGIRSTSVERPLQINLFMQNKANFQKSQMNVNNVLTSNYKNKTLRFSGKNKPKTNQIQSQPNPKQIQFGNYGKPPLPAQKIPNISYPAPRF